MSSTLPLPSSFIPFKYRFALTRHYPIDDEIIPFPPGIAVPVNIAYNYFVTRIDKLILDMEEGSAAVLNIVWDLTHGGRLATATAGGAAWGGGESQRSATPE